MNIIPIKRFTVFGNSMLPTLKPKQDVLVWCWFLNLKVGDIVVIHKNNKDMIKRIQKVHGREYYVIGDNAKESTDSKSFGWIKREEIIGKVFFIENFKL